MNEVIQYYNEIASKYDEDRFQNSYGSFIHKQETKILDILLNNQSGVILDLACGSGRLLNYATFGADGSIEMIQIAKQKHPDKEIHLADAEKLPFENESIDCIYSFHFFMHLNPEKVHKIMHECQRVLKKGGRIIFDIPSQKRRNLLHYKAQNWHGAFGSNIKELQLNFQDSFSLKSLRGILFLPIHRFPKPVRKFFIGLDQLLAKSFLKEYSSYLVIEFVKK